MRRALTNTRRSQETDPGNVDHIAVGRSGDRFLIAVASSREAARELLEQAVVEAPAWSAARHARLEGVISGDHYLASTDPRLQEALRWLELTTDSLVTRQRGDGIYAGLPWFNEYWGRDSFISLPGATLVTGHFEEARAILTSFAKFQDLDRASRFYGRLPNIVKPGSIDYHTTDGTPRWVIALRDYVRYTGDRSIVTELYPNVQASIEGALANFTDAVRLPGARGQRDMDGCAPRTRQGVVLAAQHARQRHPGAVVRAAAGGRAIRDCRRRHRIGHALVSRRGSAAQPVRARLREPATGRIADHLDARDVPNQQLRPNALFALQLLDQPTDAARAARQAWEALAYPWGVATLDQGDPDFHPYHVAPEHYHKDAAYHNGAVWPWLNGIAMQRMIELGQSDLAWRLFTNTNEIALTRGVVGGLPENLDAYPHPGETAPRLTGTYLQGWSNAEQLRVWYQGFLGIQPDLERGVIHLAPRLPKSAGNVEFNSRVGVGRAARTLRAVQPRLALHVAADRAGRKARGRHRPVRATHVCRRSPATHSSSSNDTNELLVRHLGATGKELERATLTISSSAARAAGAS